MIPQGQGFSTDYTKSENRGVIQGNQSNPWNLIHQNVPQFQLDPQHIKFNKNL